VGFRQTGEGIEGISSLEKERGLERETERERRVRVKEGAIRLL